MTPDQSNPIYCIECNQPMNNHDATCSDAGAPVIQEERVIHYIAMSGTHGCLPDHCQSHTTYDAAVNGLCDLFELGRTRRSRLSRGKYLELTAKDGAEYCEIVSCDCADAESHNDN